MNLTTARNGVPVPGRRKRLALVVGLVAVAAHVGRLKLGVTHDPRLAALRDGFDGGNADASLRPLVRHGAVHHGANHPSPAGSSGA